MLTGPRRSARRPRTRRAGPGRLPTVLVTALALLLGLVGPVLAIDHGEPLPVRASVRSVGEITPDVRIVGSGWGHGVGMSQYGAYAQAQAGRSVDQILGLYYPGTAVTPDVRSSERRIRVSILNDVSSSHVEAVDGPVDWQACRPDPDKGETIGGRVTDCTDWFTQQEGTRLVVCPVREPAVNEESGTAIPDVDRRDGIRVVGWDAHEADGCRGAAHRQTFNYPVARVAHDGTTIRTPSHLVTTVAYRHGWRDFHSRQQGTRLNSVQDVPSVELYLRGLAEVPSSWGELGPAALEAQAVTGRTFAIGRLGLSDGCACDLRATPADQNYTGYSKEAEPIHGVHWVAAVAATQDRVLTHEGDLAQTFYSSSHGGRTENIEDSWAYGTDPIPYLRSQDDPWSLDPRAGNRRAHWEALAANDAMAALLSTDDTPTITRVERIAVRSRTDGGTPRDIEVAGRTADGERVSFTTGLAARYPKGIAAAAMRRELPIEEGGTGGRLNSSQIRRFGFAPFDDDDGTVHEYAITWAAQAGVVRGIDDTRFAPGRAVTRAQMATFLVNTFEIDVPPATGVFPDVAPGQTHADNIEALVAAGVANGFGDGTYRPDQQVTRAQMASFLAGALALNAEDLASFDDVRADSVHAAGIAGIAEAGITGGCATDRFCPDDAVQRGQLASFLQRTVQG